MYHPTLSKSGRILFAPLIKLCEFLGNHFPRVLIELRYWSIYKKRINLKNPLDLNEKIMWAKLYSDTSRWTQLADKYEVRKYVESIGLADILVHLYGRWTDVIEFDFDTLPNSFILKANNGDGKGTNKIVHDKSALTNKEKEDLLQLMDEWLHKKNIGALIAEPHYKGMKPCVIAEELLPIEEGATTLTDYKIWCFNGKAYYIWVCNDRSKGGNSAHVMTYDLEWNAHPEWSVFNSDYLRGEIIPKPENLDEMITIAEKLTQGLPEVRCDLYNIKGKIYFGELTFTSQGGLNSFYTPDFLKEMGSKFSIEDFPKKP